MPQSVSSPTARSSSARFFFHLLPNAHLDPVWLWDWREGLNEGLITVRTILDLMDEYPQLTFIRGESSIYRHIEKTDPATFDRIGRMVEKGRWDIVGGTYNQPDTNLASAETLCRQFEAGLSYFQSRFGVAPRVAWQADSFGHTPGLPNILRAFGMEAFAFTRPDRRQFPMPEPAFWWETDFKERILCYRQYFIAYCSERGNLPQVLDETLQKAAEHPLVHVGVFMGLGNHGGGPSRRHIAAAAAWAKTHPEVEVQFSTLHRFFEALSGEVRIKSARVPTVRGDLGFCLRGCYSSVAKFKSAYRRAEARVTQAEQVQTVVAAALDKPQSSLEQAWEGILFNSFHDILPGSSIERAFEDQLSWVGLSAHQALAAQFAALNHLAGEIDTRVPAASHPDRPTDVPLLVWNPLPRPFKGWVEVEANLDYRPIWGHTADIGSLPLSFVGPDGERPRFQEIATEHNSMRDAAWRKRLAVFTEIPAFGWKVFQLGYRERVRSKPASAKADDCSIVSGEFPAISNRLWNVEVSEDAAIAIRYRGENFFGGSGAMRVEVVDDPWGSWGGMIEQQDAITLSKVRETWKISHHAILEAGPERSKLWTRWQGKNSWLDLTFSVARDGREVRVHGRLLWNERSARLRLVFPSAGRFLMQAPASRAERSQAGQLPCGRWFRRGSGEKAIGFISDVFSDVDATSEETRVTVARASRYADDVFTPPEKDPWLPSTDCGELKFEFWLAPGSADLELLSQELLHPPVALTVPAHPGPLPATGSLGCVEPKCIALLGAKLDDSGLLAVRVQNRSEQMQEASITIGQRTVSLGALRPYEIRNCSVQSRVAAPARKQSRSKPARRRSPAGAKIEA